MTRIIIENIQDLLKLGPSFCARHISKALRRPIHIADLDGRKIFMRVGSSDFKTFRDIFRDKNWDFTKFEQSKKVFARYKSIIEENKTPIIIDAGANAGAASIWLAENFPQALIYSVEPDPDNAKICRLNTSSFHNIRVVEAALGSHPGRVSLNQYGAQKISTTTTRNSDGDTLITTVPDLTTEGELLIIKIDIEGFEDDLFSSNTKWIDGVTAILFEPHDWLLPGRYTSAPFLTAVACRRFEMLILRDNLVFVK